ncbi:unnamed protein product, partial [Prorocentrum cordatum]
GNYNDPVPFTNESSDALYRVQALTYLQYLDRLLVEMLRILKPDAKLSFLDWFKLDSYRPAQGDQGGDRREYTEALERAGFGVISSAELMERYFVAAESVVSFLTDWKVIPGHLKILLERLNEGGASCVESDKLRLSPPAGRS